MCKVDIGDMTHGGLPLYTVGNNGVESQPPAKQEFLVNPIHPTEAESAILTEAIKVIVLECANSGVCATIVDGGT